MDRELFSKIQCRLVEEEKLPIPYAAVLAAQALYDFAPELQQAVLHWANGESVAGAELDGTAVEEIQEEIGGSEFLGLCVLNQVVRHPGCFEAAVLNVQRDFVDWEK